LHFACEYSRTNIATLLIENKASIDIVDNKGWTPLHYACRYSHADTAKLLIQNGADITLSNIVGKTPLDYIEDPKLKKELQQLAQEYQAKKVTGPSTLFHPNSEQPNNNENPHNNEEGVYESNYTL